MPVWRSLIRQKAASFNGDISADSHVISNGDWLLRSENAAIADGYLPSNLNVFRALNLGAPVAETGAVGVLQHSEEKQQAQGPIDQ